MSFRAKVLVSITTTVALAVWIATLAFSAMLTRSFEERDRQRTSTLMTQFRREYTRRGSEVAQRVDTIARSQAVARIAAEAVDHSPFVNDAQTLAQEQGLDYLEIVAANGNIISSAQWPARFGYREEWLLTSTDWYKEKPFLKREEIAEGQTLGLFSVRTVSAAEGQIFVVGGVQLDNSFLESLPVSEGMTILLYRDLTPDFATANLVGPSDLQSSPIIRQLVEQVRRDPKESTRTIPLPDGEQLVTAIPLEGRESKLIAVLLVLNSRAELASLTRYLRLTALGIGSAGVLLGIVLSFWSASRVAQPVRELAASVRKVSAGDWNTRAPVRSGDEIGQLAADFNRMAQQLVETREQMLQAERVAAWRELARRLAHELKNPLFPLQITVENLQRARQCAPEEFDEVFNESTGTLLAELSNLKQIIGRFSDFARMPAPQLQATDLNGLVRATMQLIDAQLKTPGRPAITPEVRLDAALPVVMADPDQIQRALRNLVLNAMDAMPQGGTLRVTTGQSDSRVILEVTDSGHGLTKEEAERLFTPYYTTKQHGTGLGLAIVQSVVSDHGGAISVNSEPGHGATFRIELPKQR